MTEVELLVHVKKEGKLLLTPEWANLLKIIAQTGSLYAASKETGVSYNKTWLIIDAMNNINNKPLVIKLRGGKGGGGAILTDFGKLIINEYDVLETEVQRFVKKLNTEINM